jgi:hypothetical protein
MNNYEPVENKSLTWAIDSIKQEARNAALEEAAKVAIAWEPKNLGEAESGWEARKKISEAILQLRAPPTFIADAADNK